MGSDSLGNGGSVAHDRFAGQLAGAGRTARREPDPGEELLPHDGGLPEGPARPTLADLDALAEPVFPAGWLDDPTSGGPGTGSLADHPLLRGLLLELPPKGTAPAPGWLDRWFEAARSILELLYVQDGQRR